MRKGTIYGNRATDSCLVIIINRKGDTILTHLDKGIEPWFMARMIKVGSDNFVIKRDFRYVETDTTNTYYSPLSRAVEDSYNDIDYPMDSYYRLDSVNKKLEQLKPVSKTEVLKKINKKFHFKENIKVLASTNKYTYIAKDTLNESQVYYQINTTYIPQKRNSEWVLKSNIFSGLANVHKLGIYKNNVTISTKSLANSFVNIPINLLGQKANGYSIYLKYYSKFLCDTKINKRCLNEFVRLEVVLREETKKSDKVIETFTNDTLFENQPFEMFKYKYGDYFIGVLPEIGTEYKESIFRLDTINWKLDRVKSFNKKVDSKFTRYKKDKNSLISGVVSQYMATFLEQYEIVKVGDSYKLMGGYD